MLFPSVCFDFLWIQYYGYSMFLFSYHVLWLFPLVNDFGLFILLCLLSVHICLWSLVWTWKVQTINWSLNTLVLSFVYLVNSKHGFSEMQISSCLTEWTEIKKLSFTFSCSVNCLWDWIARISQCQSFCSEGRFHFLEDLCSI